MNRWISFIHISFREISLTSKPETHRVTSIPMMDVQSFYSIYFPLSSWLLAFTRKHCGLDGF
jgi:hypothetical protein